MEGTKVTNEVCRLLSFYPSSLKSGVGHALTDAALFEDIVLDAL
jgi:hypothetical protein